MILTKGSWQNRSAIETIITRFIVDISLRGRHGASDGDPGLTKVGPSVRTAAKPLKIWGKGRLIGVKAHVFG
jgi:hypothetical protein